jgi:nitroimidazol reductase NimA-like FMN-containing flavoprotein (pyridoxamine 5'-phosphate oxidase superfamily)
MPKGYRMPKGSKGMLSWDAVEKKIANAHNYWVCTTRPDGRPHTMPVWGVWVDGAVYFGTDGASRKARNIQANPAMVIHLELLKEAVILEGEAERANAVSKEIDAAYSRKYKMKLSDAPGEMFLVRLQPRVVMAWTEKEFMTSPTRWEFASK